MKGERRTNSIGDEVGTGGGAEITEEEDHNPLSGFFASVCEGAQQWRIKEIKANRRTHTKL